MNFKLLLLSALLCLSGFAVQTQADTLEIREWLVPYKKSMPRDPYVGDRGRVWFVGQKDNYIGNMHPNDGLFNRYDLPGGTGPNNLVIDADRNIWFAAGKGGYIGKLQSATGKIETFKMPDRKAKDPHTLVLNSNGDIWFTVKDGNFVGRMQVANDSIELLPVATKKAQPHGIVIDHDDIPWVVTSGSNKLIRVNPENMTLQEIEIPNSDARPRRLGVTSNGDIWFVDYANGRLGRYVPADNEFSEWRMPGGDDSEPYGMAVDREDRIWIVECGVTPNRIVGFDTRSGIFLTPTNIPSGAGSVRHMYYHEPGGEVWFGTDSNYVGRAKVHETYVNN